MPAFTTLTSAILPLPIDNIDTDQIIPARFLKATDKAGLGDSLFADWRFTPDGQPRPDFPLNRPEYRGAQILVAGDNFGCGSSREHAPIAIKGAGVSCVIASSFARIFYRNAINIGLPILECEAAAEGIKAGDEVEIELESGHIKNLSSGEEFQAMPFPEFMQGIMAKGGLINYVKGKGV